MVGSEGDRISTPLLSLRGVIKRFAGVVALDGASLEISAGEVHALVGENGAGKSTLIKVLTGYYRKEAGEVLFDGRRFEVDSPQAAQVAGISTIYQEINLVGLRSVTENICLGRRFRRFGLIDWSAMHAEAKRLLERLDLSIDVRQPLDAYPIATQQMVAIARTLGFSSKLVIMDEPTSSLDDREVQVLFRVIRQLKADGISIVFVSHRLDEIYSICDRVTIMRDGRTVRSGRIADISKIALVSTMLGRDLRSTEGVRQTGFGQKAEGQHPTILIARELSRGNQVRDVSFDVGKGEIVGLSGLLGAGRTESARLVFGADRPDRGSLTFNQHPFDPLHPADAIAVGIGYCTEDRKREGIVPDLSVRENLTLALLPRLTRLGVVDERRQQLIVDRFIERLGIKCSSSEQPVRELSGGNQQKVLLARWLALDPLLLILDEPTRGIDVGAKVEIQKLVRELADRGLGLLMVSSEVEEIVEGADRAYVLRDGRTVGAFEGSTLTAEAIMTAMAHGSEADHRLHETGLPVHG